jgi:two-component system chemotaxis response regulator CheB
MNRDIVVIGGSRGVFDVLRKFAAQLPPGVPAAICIVRHIGSHDSVLPELLSAWGPVHAHHAKDGEEVSTGRIYVAPPGKHMRLFKGTIRLDEGAPENFARPAVDPLFRSAALEYGPRVVAAVLSGDLDDGAAGLAMIRAYGGYCIVQDPADCEAPSMPRTALAAAGADAVATSDAFASHVVAAIQGARLSSPEVSQMRKRQSRLEEEVARNLTARPEDLDAIGERSIATCPECGGILWRMNDESLPRYRCHTGHAFGALSLRAGQERVEENALWSAIRAVNERVALARERHAWAMRMGDLKRISAEHARIEEGEKIAEMLAGVVKRLVSEDHT